VSSVTACRDRWSRRSFEVLWMDIERDAFAAALFCLHEPEIGG
jgi:hypothetical protein